MNTAQHATVLDRSLQWLGRKIAGKLTQRSRGYTPFTFSGRAARRRTLRPADVLRIEGNQRLYGAIKYVIQSAWSHAALLVGDAAAQLADGSEPNRLIEANLEEGVVAVPLSKYAYFNTKICGPVGLTIGDKQKVIDGMIAHLGARHDTRHIFDLARYLLPTPPVPVRWRRRMIAFGAGYPTRTIFSALIVKLETGLDYRRLLWGGRPRVQMWRPLEPMPSRSELCNGLYQGRSELWTRRSLEARRSSSSRPTPSMHPG